MHEAQSVVQRYATSSRRECRPDRGHGCWPGMAKELGAGAAPGAVVADENSDVGRRVLVRIVAGDQGVGEAFVRTTDSRGSP